MREDTLPDDVLIFIASNKHDINDSNTSLDDQVKEYSDTIKAEFFNVSAKTGIGIDDLFLRITAKFLRTQIKNKTSVIIDPSKHDKGHKKKKRMC